MTGSAGAQSESNRATDTHVGIARQIDRNRPTRWSLVSALMQVARAKWPTKTAPAIQVRTGVTLRQAERLVGEHTGISGPVFAQLIRSDEGLDFLEALMSEPGARIPSWWEAFKYHSQAAQLEADLAAARERLKQSRKKRNGLVARRT